METPFEVQHLKNFPQFHKDIAGVESRGWPFQAADAYKSADEPQNEKGTNFKDRRSICEFDD